MELFTFTLLEKLVNPLMDHMLPLNILISQPDVYGITFSEDFGLTHSFKEATNSFVQVLLWCGISVKDNLVKQIIFQYAKVSADFLDIISDPFLLVLCYLLLFKQSELC